MIGRLSCKMPIAAIHNRHKLCFILWGAREFFGVDKDTSLTIYYEKINTINQLIIKSYNTNNRRRVKSFKILIINYY